MRSNKNRKTYDFNDAKYSPELIRQYENPEYAKAADAYEREARRRKSGRHSAEAVKENRESSYDDFEAMLEAEYGRGEKNRSNRKKRNNIKSKKKKKYKLNKFTILRNIILFILLLCALAVGFFFFVTKGIDSDHTQDYEFDIDPQVAEDLKDYRNILILGSDARADESIDGSRTDAIILMSINKKTSDVHLISLMRDSYLEMDDGTGDLFLDKLTHAHAYGGGVNVAATLNRNLDLNIEEYIVFNWQAVADAVDALGGIEIDVKEDELEDFNHYGYETAANVGKDFTEISSAGVQKLDGVQATTYCRIRKYCGGDEGRTGRYKKVLAGVMKKAVTHPWKIGEVTEIISPNIRTNMNQMSMFTAGVRAPLFDIQEGITWPEEYWGGFLGEVSYVVPQSLEHNVEMLHEKAFEQPGYMVTHRCREISNWIMEDSGVYY